MASRVGEVRVNADTGAVAVLRYGSKVTGPMWFVVPMDDEPRWSTVADKIHEWPFLAQALG